MYGKSRWVGSPRSTTDASRPSTSRRRRPSPAATTRTDGPRSRRLAMLGGDAFGARLGAREPERLGDQLVGAPAGRVVVDDAHHDRLLGTVGRGDLADAGL